MGRDAPISESNSDELSLLPSEPLCHFKTLIIKSADWKSLAKHAFSSEHKQGSANLILLQFCLILGKLDGGEWQRGNSKSLWIAVSENSWYWVQGLLQVWSFPTTDLVSKLPTQGVSVQQIDSNVASSTHSRALQKTSNAGNWLKKRLKYLRSESKGTNLSPQRIDIPEEWRSSCKC